MIDHGRIEIRDRKHVVVLHVEVVAFVVVGDVVVQVVGGVNVNFPLKNMGRGIGGENVGDEGFFPHRN